MAVLQDRKAIRVWNVQVEGEDVRVATVEQGARKPSLCEGCSAPCCRGILRPVLDEAEFKSRRYPTLFLEPPEWMREQVPRAQAIATLGMPEDGPCGYLDAEANRCTAWPNCPAGCLAYDCREDDREEIREFAERRVAEVG